jgi:chorismate mutase
MLAQILEHFPEEELLKANGFDDAIIGVDQQSMRLIYSVKKCLRILMKEMNYDDAVEYFHFNVSGSHMGGKTPIWCEDEF